MINNINRVKGITLMSLLITIVILLILSGITIGSAINHQGLMDKTGESKSKVEKETLIQKIEADIFEEKTIKNRDLTETEVENIFSNYGNIEERDGEKLLISTEGNYEIFFSEIIY